ncbi:ferritin-like domain-containing protein [Amycolatopsis thermalba]|uniref:Ferritin-like domain-containing protein n=1 Tax=Amycolatopsis thermalba TaxID=944492 RepID=A0ABY4NZ63_9PSEU|nr:MULTISPECIES: ferritin-like domain-containing protein [Amycolatopsis]UQS25313.1 ferritin-like domain-containing protein [Amycolatopsis thermalba]
MFGQDYVAKIIHRSAETPADRRRFLRSAGLAGLGVVGAGALGSPGFASAATAARTRQDAQQLSDASVLNFALNPEYLEAQFYLHAVRGEGLPETLRTGRGNQGPVTGGRRVRFRSKRIRQYAEEIAGDELAHVRFLRSALGSAAVAQPAIDVQTSFTAAAQAAGIVRQGRTFDPYASEENFLLAAFLFEDVGVTAYKGAAPLIQNKTYLEAAAGILAAEAYHAANIRTSILETGANVFGAGVLSRNLDDAANKLSDARDSLDGTTDLDQGVRDARGNANIVPTDQFGVTYSRSAAQVLNIVYLTPGQTTRGGFFPSGVNGEINTSAGNA